MRPYPVEVIENLVRVGLMSVQRNSEGRPVCARFLAQPEPTAKVRTTVSTGTYYSFEELLETGHSVWQHKPFIRPGQLDTLASGSFDVEDAAAFVRATFLATALSCMTAGAKPPKVLRTAIAVSVGPKKAEALKRKWNKHEKKKTRTASS